MRDKLQKKGRKQEKEEEECLLLIWSVTGYRLRASWPLGICPELIPNLRPEAWPVVGMWPDTDNLVRGCFPSSQVNTLFHLEPEFVKADCLPGWTENLGGLGALRGCFDDPVGRVMRAGCSLALNCTKELRRTTEQKNGLQFHHNVFWDLCDLNKAFSNLMLWSAPFGFEQIGPWLKAIAISHKNPAQRGKFMTLVVVVTVMEAPAHCAENGSGSKMAVSQQLSERSINTPLKQHSSGLQTAFSCRFCFVSLVADERRAPSRSHL